MARKSVVKSDTNIITLKVSLRETKPPIWRRLAVPDTMTLSDLHVAIQVVMGWCFGHMHVFEIGGESYSDPEMLDDAVNEERIKLKKIQASGITRFSYTYDFGDDWEHSIVLEKNGPAIAGQSYPVCIAGKQACPTEDCGGVWGYYELLDILADPSHPEHAEQLEWVGGEIDPEEFDIDEVNARLASVFNGK